MNFIEKIRASIPNKVIGKDTFVGDSIKNNPPVGNITILNSSRVRKIGRKCFVILHWLDSGGNQREGGLQIKRCSQKKMLSFSRA